MSLLDSLGSLAGSALDFLGNNSGTLMTGWAMNDANKSLGRIPTKLKANGTLLDNGKFKLDPTIRSRFNQAYGSLGRYIPQANEFFRAGMRDNASLLGLNDTSIGLNNQLRSSLLNNRTGYVNSVLNPLRQQIAQQQGMLTADQGRRGIRGSSFGDQTLSNFATDSGRALTDATSQAENQLTGMLMDVDNQRANLIQQRGGMYDARNALRQGNIATKAELINQQNAINSARANLDLAGLQLSNDQIGNLVKIIQSQNEMRGRGLDAMGRSVSGGGGGGSGLGDLIGGAVSAGSGLLGFGGGGLGSAVLGAFGGF